MADQVKKKSGKLNRLVIVIMLLALLFVAYVEIANRNSHDMTYRQKVLRAFYPAFTWFNRITGKKNKKMENSEIKAPESFYGLNMTLNNGEKLEFGSLKGRKVLIVNTASDCGFTGQYEGLQSLFQKYDQELVVLGFPANDFKEQEKGTDEEIAHFCKVNYGVSFPIARKSVVIPGSEQNPVFAWLSRKEKNGWNDTPPVWNFTKFLVNEEGKLVNYFGPSVEPMSDEVIAAVEK